MNMMIESAAMNLRRCIECRMDGDMTGPAVTDLVAALGGDPTVIVEAAGRPHLAAAYLVALVLTRPDGDAT